MALESVSPGGIGWGAGLRVGDVLKDVEGGKRTGNLIVDPIGAVREDAPGTFISVDTHTATFIEGGAREVFWMIGIMFALGAAATLVTRPWDGAAWALFPLLMGVGLVLALAPVSGTRGVVGIQSLTATGLMLATSGSAWLFSVFPQRQIHRRDKRYLALVGTASLAAIFYVLILLGLTVIPDVYNAGVGAAGLLMGATLFAGMIQLAVAQRQSTARVRRMQILSLGTVLIVGFGPAVFLTLLPLSFGVPEDRVPVVASIGILAIVPFGFFYTMTQYQLRYVFFPARYLGSVLVLYGGFVLGGLAGLLAGKYFPSQVDMTGAGVVISGLGGVLIAALTLGIRRLSVAFQLEAPNGVEELGQRAGFSRSLAEQVRQGERHRLALELHDGPLQSLTRAFLQLGTTPGIEPAMESLDQAVREMRLLVQFGTPPGVAEDFVGTLERLIKTTEDLAQVAIVFGVQGNERLESLPTEKKVALYRVLQEALSNVVRHSKAAEAVVRVEADRNRARLVVRDNGVGFDTGQATRGGHFGLQGFKTRAEAEGGTCDIQSKPGAGTTIAFEIPYE